MSHRKTGRTRATGFSLLASLLLIPQFARSAGATQPASQLQADYLSALAAVDHFLQAWQSQDVENGTSLLTSRAKTAASTEIVDKFFSSETPSAYEIERGKMLGRTRYEFRVDNCDAQPYPSEVRQHYSFKYWRQRLGHR